MEYVEVARAESERGEIVLRERRDPDLGDNAPAALELRVNGVFVMDTLETATEQELARVALTHATDPRVVLIGGLGLGFTLHEVLGDSRVERVDVVEIEDALVRWMRDGTVPHGPSYLADVRVRVLEADIRTAVNEAPLDAYDLVLLDVDNGPDFLVHAGNAQVYEDNFLRQVAAILRPGGAVAIWSASESEALRCAMHEVFGNVVPVPYDVRLQSRDEQYWLYLSH
jgi:spermidine synthase